MKHVPIDAYFVRPFCRLLEQEEPREGITTREWAPSRMQVDVQSEKDYKNGQKCR